MADSFYVALEPSTLNQGDIVDHVPWGLIEAPTTLCRPNNRHEPNGKAFYGAVQDLKKPPAWTHDPEFIHGLGWEGLAIVLWHGCQIDKWKNQDGADGSRLAKAFAAVAPILPIANLQPEGTRAQVAAKKHHSFFPLPAFTAGGREISESYVDLRHIWSIRQSSLTHRVAGISETARLSLYEHLFTFFTRFKLDLDATCPQCGASVPLRTVEDEEIPLELAVEDEEAVVDPPKE